MLINAKFNLDYEEINLCGKWSTIWYFGLILSGTGFYFTTSFYNIEKTDKLLCADI